MGRCPRPLDAWSRSLEVWRGRCRGLTLLPSPRQSPGPRPKTADQGAPRSGWGLPESSSDPSTPMPPDFLRLLPVHPGLLLSAHLPVSGSGREGRGLPAPRSPRAHSSASRMAAAPRAGGGQQVLGRAPTSRGGWVCCSHPVARRSRQAPPHCAPPPGPRARPRPSATPPSGRPRPAALRVLKKPGLSPRLPCTRSALRRCFPATVQGEARSDRLGRRASTPPRVRTSPHQLCCPPASRPPPGPAAIDRAGPFFRLPAGQRRAHPTPRTGPLRNTGSRGVHGLLLGAGGRAGRAPLHSA